MTEYSTPRLSVFVRQMKSDEIVVTYNKFLLQVSFCPITYSNINTNCFQLVFIQRTLKMMSSLNFTYNSDVDDVIGDRFPAHDK